MKKNLAAQIEALLFVTGDNGLSFSQLQFLTEEPAEAVEQAITDLMQQFEEDGRGIVLKQLAGVYRLVTKPEMAETIQKLVENPTVQALSQASLEVLAIVAYKQPITRVELEDLRGVKSEKALATLAGKGLIRECGRAEGTGRAILYGTTAEFLDYFGLKNLDELPPLPEEFDEEPEEEADLFMTKFQEAFKEEVNA